MTELAVWLTDPFAYPFMQRALLAALVVGGAVPILGTYIVLRGMAFYGSALAHIVLPGVVVAFVLGWPTAGGALVVGVIAAVIIGLLGGRAAISSDTAIGVVFTAFFALGVALLSLQRSYAVELSHILFGNLLGVSRTDLVVMVLLAAGVLLTVTLLYKEFLVISFDQVLARTMQLPVALLNSLLLVLLAVVIVISIQAVGVALVLAMLVTPPATAQLVTRRLPTMMLVSGILGSASGVAGLYLSYYGGVASGPAIVLVATAIFGLTVLLAPRRGLLASRLRQSRGAHAERRPEDPAASAGQRA